MGKKRIIRKQGSSVDRGLQSRSLSRLPKKKLDKGILHIQATYNNTKVLFSDMQGNAIMWSTSGGLGFTGAKKSTPFAAAKVGEVVGEKAAAIGVKEAEVIIRGVGPGRESAMRSFASKGIAIVKITDDTPVPHNGPQQRKPRRV